MQLCVIVIQDHGGSRHSVCSCVSSRFKTTVVEDTQYEAVCHHGSRTGWLKTLRMKLCVTIVQEHGGSRGDVVLALCVIMVQDTPYEAVCHHS